MNYGQIDMMLRETGYPERDLYSLPDSPLRFPDGAQYRIEVSGVERLSTLEILLDEQAKQNVPIHRLISTVMGSTYLTQEELKGFARLAHDAKMEVIISPGPRGSWDVGAKTSCTPEGSGAGTNLRGMDSLRNYIRDVYRCIELGFRGFLCTDEGALYVMNELRAAGKIPSDVIFKVSVATGHAHAGAAKMMQSIGANTFNPSCDTTLPQLAAMRSVCQIPFDIHVVNFDEQGGQNRMWDVADIARVAAPVYFKVEPGTSFCGLYKLWNEQPNNSLIREKVRIAKIIQEIMAGVAPEVVCSGPAPEDLLIPVV